MIHSFLLIGQSNMAGRGFPAEVEKLPKVSGSGRRADQVYIAPDVDKAIRAAEDSAKGMKDEYISVEHLFLGLLECANGDLSRLFRTYNVSNETILSALSKVRGNQRVTTDDPEQTYDALKKYGTDLVARAREKELDPVIETHVRALGIDVVGKEMFSLLGEFSQQTIAAAFGKERIAATTITS